MLLEGRKQCQEGQILKFCYAFLLPAAYQIWQPANLVKIPAKIVRREQKAEKPYIA